MLMDTRLSVSVHVFAIPAESGREKECKNAFEKRMQRKGISYIKSIVYAGEDNDLCCFVYTFPEITDMEVVKTMYGKVAAKKGLDPEHFTLVKRNFNLLAPRAEDF